MRTLAILKNLTLTLLLTFAASGVVNAKLASGPQTLGLDLHQAASWLEAAPRLGWSGSSYDAASESPVVPRGAAPEKLFHFTQSRNAGAIAETGLRRGASGKVFTTPQGNLSPLQAQIDLALPPNRGLPNAAFEIDVATLRRLGIDVPAPTQVGRSFNLPGGGLEVPILRDIPPEALRRVR